jgi:hypothetical protein
MLGPTNRAVNAREKDRGGVEAFAIGNMPVGIWCPVSGHLTMTTPIELSLFSRSIRRHTTLLCEHHLTRRPDRRKFIEFTENVGVKKYVIFIKQN